MTISLTSLITLVICTSISMAIVVCLCNNSIVGKIGIYPLLGVFLVVTTRFFVPFELPFAISIPLGGVYATTVEYLRASISIAWFRIEAGNVLLFIWFTGTLAQTCRLFYRSHLFIRNVRRHAVRVVNADTLKNLQDVMHEKNYAGDVQLYHTSAVKIPFAAGLFRPCIFLPELPLSDEEERHILRHELTHYLNGDLWIKLIIEGLVLLYWWNPIVYLFRKQISMALEMRVDYGVAKPLSELDRLMYFQTILKIARANVHTASHRQGFVVMADGNNKSTLERRMRLVIDASDKSLSHNTRRSRATVLFAIVAIIFSCSFVLEPYIVTPDVLEESYTIKDKESFIVVNEDGYYDIFINDVHIGTSKTIQDSFSDLRIYESGKVEE